MGSRGRGLWNQWMGMSHAFHTMATSKIVLGLVSTSNRSSQSRPNNKTNSASTLNVESQSTACWWRSLATITTACSITKRWTQSKSICLRRWYGTATCSPNTWSSCIACNLCMAHGPIGVCRLYGWLVRWFYVSEIPSFHLLTIIESLFIRSAKNHLLIHVLFVINSTSRRRGCWRIERRSTGWDSATVHQTGGGQIRCSDHLLGSHLLVYPANNRIQSLQRPKCFDRLSCQPSSAPQSQRSAVTLQRKNKLPQLLAGQAIL